MTTAVSAAPGCSQARCVAAFTPRRRRGRKPRSALSSTTASQDFQPARASARSQPLCTTALRLSVVRSAAARSYSLEEGTGPIGRANVDRYLGGLLAMTGAVDDGRDLVMHAAAAFDDLGQTGAARYCDALLADVEVLADDIPAARRALEAVCAYCQESEDVGLLGTTASRLAEASLLGWRLRSCRALGGYLPENMSHPTISSLRSHGDPCGRSCSH